MRRLAISLLCVLSIPNPVFAGVSHIKSMEQSADDRFNVICLDGRTEATSTRKLLDNLVCVTEGTSTSLSGKKVFCTAGRYSDEFHITRVSDNKLLGAYTSLTTCRRMVKASTDKLVCTIGRYSDEVYITNIADGKQIGSYVSLENCLLLISDTQ